MKTKHTYRLLAAPALALAAAIGSLWWFVWVPNWRPPLDAGEEYGIDVSSHQGAIDWESVRRDDIDFSYIKATEGGDFVDARFHENWSDSRRAGLEHGAYHFFTLCAPGGVQASNFLGTAPPDSEALPPAVDLELAGNCSTRPSTARVYRELGIFLDRVESAWSEELILYVGQDWEAKYPTRSRVGRPLWLRRFLLRPASDDWTIWQLHGYAQVDGIDGPVDLDVGRFNVQ